MWFCVCELVGQTLDLKYVVGGKSLSLLRVI